MVNRLEEKSWAQATAALERARGRLGEGESGTAALRQSLERGHRDLEMVARLDTIQAESATDERNTAPESADEAYAKAFVWYGWGRTDEGHELVAARIRESNIRGALVDALDFWTISLRLEKPDRKAWLLRVARLADRDQSEWVVLARDPQARRARK